MVAESFEAAYRLHATDLIRYATAMVGPHDAPDVVTDALLRVFDGRVDRASIGDVRAFLFRAVHRRVIDLERSNTRRRRRDAVFSRQRDDSSARDLASAADARAALAALSPQQRTVVFLTYWCGHTPAEVGLVLDVTDGTVRKQLARARARLREVLHD